ncbi:MAG: NUDIX hydrolase [bacterium]
MLQTTDEQLDTINEKNVVISSTSKSIAHRAGLLHRIVIGEIVNSKREYCFVKQAGDRQDPGQYISPIGGHVQAGERIEDALCRKCHEEVGFTPVELKYVGGTIYNREVIGRRENHFFLVYMIRHNGPVILNHESVDYQWFSVEKIQQTLQSSPQTFDAAWHHVFKNIFLKIYQTT